MAESEVGPQAFVILPRSRAQCDTVPCSRRERSGLPPMSLLTEIQAAATDPSHSTADLLRKCQILAFRLRHEPFKQWVGHELSGARS